MGAGPYNLSDSFIFNMSKIPKFISEKFLLLNSGKLSETQFIGEIEFYMTDYHKVIEKFSCSPIGYFLVFAPNDSSHRMSVWTFTKKDFCSPYKLSNFRTLLPEDYFREARALKERMSKYLSFPDERILNLTVLTLVFQPNLALDSCLSIYYLSLSYSLQEFNGSAKLRTA